MAEPICCDEPMIHNSFTGEYECADAYFTVLDEGAISDWSPRHHNPSELPDWLRGRYEHWLASMRPDGFDLVSTTTGSNPGGGPS